MVAGHYASYVGEFFEGYFKLSILVFVPKKEKRRLSVSPSCVFQRVPRFNFWIRRVTFSKLDMNTVVPGGRVKAILFNSSSQYVVRSSSKVS